MPGTLSKYTILKTVGSGASCKVKLGYITETKQEVAIKIINDNTDENLMKLIKDEIEAMGKIKHLNVIGQIDYGEADYVKENGKSRKVSYIILEFAKGGELFDFVSISGRFDEPLARYFFKQFMNGLDHCHQAGIAHRDLKPENLLYDENYDIKIADFGFAAPVAGRVGDGYLETKLGTQNYMAPEIHLKQKYQGKTVDVFASAIILFIMVAQHPPFTTAEPKDPFYRCLAANRADVFWKSHSKNKSQNFFSEEFKDMIQSMLKLNPNERLTIEQINAHPWMQADTPSREQVVEQFKLRQLQVTASQEAERAEKLAKKSQNIGNYNKMYRGAGDNDEGLKLDLSDQPPNKSLKDYKPVFQNSSVFFSSYNPDIVEKALIDQLNDAQVPFEADESCYKIKFDIITKAKEEGVADQKLGFKVKLEKVDDQTICVSFNQTDGDKIKFLEQFIEYKTKILKDYNDAPVPQF